MFVGESPDAVAPPDPDLETGSPRYDRRLSDKILAAFTQAYALGRLDVADRLLEVLNLCSEQDGPERGGPVLARAKAWMIYVQARNRCNQLSMSGADQPEAKAAQAEMKAAERAWQET